MVSAAVNQTKIHLSSKGVYLQDSTRKTGRHRVGLDLRLCVEADLPVQGCLRTSRRLVPIGVALWKRLSLIDRILQAETHTCRSPNFIINQSIFGRCKLPKPVHILILASLKDYVAFLRVIVAIMSRHGAQDLQSNRAKHRMRRRRGPRSFVIIPAVVIDFKQKVTLRTTLIFGPSDLELVRGGDLRCRSKVSLMHWSVVNSAQCGWPIEMLTGISNHF